MKKSGMFYQEVVKAILFCGSKKMGARCAHDEIPRRSAHRIFQRDGTDTPQEIIRGRVGLPALVRCAKGFRATDNWDINWEKVEQMIRMGGQKDNIGPIPEGRDPAGGI